MVLMPVRSASKRAVTWGVLLFGLASAALAHAAPAVGRYTGRLCVTTAVGAPECGSARVALRTARKAEVRISDLLYSLTLHSSQVDVVLKHGAMQIDGFTATYEWKGAGPGQTLHFVDAAKGVHYEVQFISRDRGRR